MSIKIQARISESLREIITHWRHLRGISESQAVAELLQISVYGIESLGMAVEGATTAWLLLQQEVERRAKAAESDLG